MTDPNSVGFDLLKGFTPPREERERLDSDRWAIKKLARHSEASANALQRIAQSLERILEIIEHERKR